MKKKRIITLVVVLVMVMAFASSALANSYYGQTLSTSGTSSTWHGTTQNRTAWTASNGTWVGSNASGLTLTVRPRANNGSDEKLSLAYSYSKTKLTGGQTYDVIASSMYIKYNTNMSGYTAALNADWHF